MADAFRGETTQGTAAERHANNLSSLEERLRNTELRNGPVRGGQGRRGPRASQEELNDRYSEESRDARFGVSDGDPPAKGPISREDARGALPREDARFSRDSREARKDSAVEGYCFFGDSFVRLFGLVKHPDIMIHPYKGASCRGLGKEGNENREDILRRLEARPNTRGAVFVFGNVDVHLSYYYCLHGKEKPTTIDFEGIARDYVTFVAGLPGEGLRRAIVGCYPSSLVEKEKGSHPQPPSHSAPHAPPDPLLATPLPPTTTTITPPPSHHPLLTPPASSFICF